MKDLYGDLLEITLVTLLTTMKIGKDYHRDRKHSTALITMLTKSFMRSLINALSHANAKKSFPFHFNKTFLNTFTVKKQPN